MPADRPSSRRPLRVLVEIVHPADVLFFGGPVRRLGRAGHEVALVSRDKDVTLELLDDLALEHRVLSRCGRGLAGLASELLKRDVALWRFARSYRPDLMVGFGGVAISHVGRLLSIPSLAFYDTDGARLQQRLTLPFIDRQYVAQSYDGPQAPGRTSRFPGVKELSYLHPENFRLDRRRAARAGYVEGRGNFLLRVVAWGSNHDTGKSGWTANTLRALVEFLSGRGQVHLSAEGELPEEFEALRYRGRPADFHHLLGHCDLCVAESATVATEAVVLGVPAIYGVNDRRCYIDDLERKALIDVVRQPGRGALLESVSRVLEDDGTALKRRREAWLRSQPNLADFVVDAILRHGYRRQKPAPVAI